MRSRLKNGFWTEAEILVDTFHVKFPPLTKFWLRLGCELMFLYNFRKNQILKIFGTFLENVKFWHIEMIDAHDTLTTQRHSTAASLWAQSIWLGVLWTTRGGLNRPRRSISTSGRFSQKSLKNVGSWKNLIMRLEHWLIAALENGIRRFGCISAETDEWWSRDRIEHEDRNSTLVMQ